MRSCIGTMYPVDQLACPVYNAMLHRVGAVLFATIIVTGNAGHERPQAGGVGVFNLTGLAYLFFFL